MHTKLFFMKKHSLKLTAATLLVTSTMLLGSCDKDDNNNKVEDRKSMLIGTWSVTQTAHDDNKNGQADADEIKDVTSDNINRETFHNDGTGTLRVKNPDIDTSFSFAWSLSSNNTYIDVTIIGQPTATVKINSMTNTDLQVESNQNPDGKDWTYLKKQ